MNKGEKLACDHLKDNDFMVEHIVVSKWNRIDFFNLFDFIAIKPNWIRFIQVSTKYMSQRDADWKERFEKFPVMKQTTKEFWHIVEKKGRFEIIAYQYVSQNGKPRRLEYEEDFDSKSRLFS